MWTLYYGPGACSMASHIAIEEAGARYEGKPVALAKGEQRTPDYLKINPNGKVPALKIDDGSVITENVAILPYVAKTHPQANLLPKDPLGESRALSIMGFFASSVHIAFAHIARPERWAKEEAALPGVKEKGREAFQGYLKQIDGMLEGRQWFLDQFSVVDGYGFVFYTWGQRIELPVKDLKNYTAHRERMMQRPAVQRMIQQEGLKLG